MEGMMRRAMECRDEISKTIRAEGTQTIEQDIEQKHGVEMMKLTETLMKVERIIDKCSQKGRGGVQAHAFNVTSPKS